MKRLNFAKATMLNEAASDPQQPIDDTMLDMGAMGHVLGRQAHFCFVGVLASPGGNERIVVATGWRGCTCGCGAHGRAFMATPSVEEARNLALQLQSFADEIEAKAAKAAADLIGRAK